MSNETKQTIVVTRDGELDDEWLDQLELEQRKLAIKQFRKILLYKLIRLPISVIRLMVNLLSILGRDTLYTV